MKGVIVLALREMVIENFFKKKQTFISTGKCVTPATEEFKY